MGIPEIVLACFRKHMNAERLVSVNVAIHRELAALGVDRKALDDGIAALIEGHLIEREKGLNTYRVLGGRSAGTPHQASSSKSVR